MNNIPEEIQTMAWLVGQSNEIDACMIQQNKDLNTNSSTIKNRLNEYLSISRGQHPQVTQQLVGVPAPSIGEPYNPAVHNQYIGDQFPPVSPIQAPMPQFYRDHPQKDEDQLEFNLTPNQGDIIINLLKEISSKLTKQNTLLQSINEKNSLKEDRVPVLTQKSGKNQ
jgi:hypothetical protein